MKLLRTRERPVVNGRSYVVALDDNKNGWLCILNSEKRLVPLFGPVVKNQKRFDTVNKTNLPYIEATLNALRRLH